MGAPSSSRVGAPGGRFVPAGVTERLGWDKTAPTRNPL